MAQIINFPEISFYGGCPRCGENSGYLNVLSDQFVVCDRHQVYWWIGAATMKS